MGAKQNNECPPVFFFVCFCFAPHFYFCLILIVLLNIEIYISYNRGISPYLLSAFAGIIGIKHVSLGRCLRFEITGGPAALVIVRKLLRAEAASLRNLALAAAEARNLPPF